MIRLFEKYRDLSEVKGIIFLNAVKTHDLEIIKSFINKGYDFNSVEVLFEATFDEDTLRFFLDKKIEIEKWKNYNDIRERLKEERVQMALIDYGYETLIYETVGFNEDLREDPDYAEIIDRYEQATKYNL